MSGAVSSLFGGDDGGEQAAKDMQRALEAAQGNIKDYYGQAIGYMNPYYSAGTNALNQYQSALAGMSDPQAFYQKMMSGYSMSPQAQFQQQQALKASNQAAAAGGTLGGGAQQKALADWTQQLTNRDQQQYLQNMLGIHNQYMGGLQGLEGQGYGAANTMGGWGMDAGKTLADLSSQIGQAQAYGDISKANSRNSLFGGILGIGTGLLSGMTGGFGGMGGLGMAGGLSNLFGGGGGGGGGYGMSWGDLQNYLPASDFYG